MLNVLLAVVQTVQPQPVLTLTPLRLQAEAIMNSPSLVRWEFISQVHPNLSTSPSNFRHVPVEEQKEAVRKAYYIRALQLAMLVPRGDPDLVEILNRITADANAEQIALDFESAYYAKFKKWPPIVPVDVEALTARMIDQRVVR